MSLHEIPALVFIIAFVVSLSPARRLNHYVLAFLVALGCGLTSAVLMMIVWGVVSLAGTKRWWWISVIAKNLMKGASRAR